MNDFIVRKIVTINAEPSKVWDALTNPEKTKKYFFNCKVFSEWRAGSSITFKGRIFLFWNIEMTGKIQAIDQQRFLRYTLSNKSDDSHTSSTVTEELSYADGVTTLTISDDVSAGEGAEKRFKKSEKGWDKVLGRLKDLVEKGEG